MLPLSGVADRVFEANVNELERVLYVCTKCKPIFYIILTKANGCSCMYYTSYVLCVYGFLVYFFWTTDI
jgi:hypothetical protein